MILRILIWFILCIAVWFLYFTLAERIDNEKDIKKKRLKIGIASFIRSVLIVLLSIILFKEFLYSNKVLGNIIIGFSLFGSVVGVVLSIIFNDDNQ